jgi:hypothetical protein
MSPDSLYRAINAGSSTDDDDILRRNANYLVLLVKVIKKLYGFYVKTGFDASRDKINCYEIYNSVATGGYYLLFLFFV